MMSSRLRLISHCLLVVFLGSACSASQSHPPESPSLNQTIQVFVDGALIEIPVKSLSPLQEFPRTVEIAKDRLLSDKSEGRGTYYPLTFGYLGTVSEKEQGDAITVKVGARVSENSNLLERSPRLGVEELERENWEAFSKSAQGIRAEALHRKNINVFETKRLAERVWERHLSEGILDKVYDYYRTPVTSSIYLNVLFIFDRQTWNSSGELREQWTSMAEELLASVVISQPIQIHEVQGAPKA